MPRPQLFFLLATVALLVRADMFKVVVVQNLNLRTSVTTDITCSSIEKILIQGAPVSNYTCTGDTLTKADEPGMYIITQMQPIATPHDNSLTWLIEYSGGNLTSSFKVEDVIDKPLTTTDTIQISEAKEKALQLDKNAIVLRQQRQVSGSAKLAEAKNETTTTISITTESRNTTEKPPEKTTKESAPTTPKAPIHINLTVTVGYLQFQTGQAPTYVNKNTQAVVFAVIEGILLGVILLVFLFRCYRRSKLRAAGLYPPRNINQPNSARNTVYYDNGGTLSYPNPNSRPEIPSYRSPDTQPPLRLDSLSPRPQQPVITPQLMPVTTTQPRPAAATVTPAPLNYWPDQPQAPPVKNIMDSDF